jgi:hypothetical protein
MGLMSTVEFENAKHEINSLKVLCQKQQEEITTLNRKMEDVSSKTFSWDPIDESFYSFQPNKSVFERTMSYHAPERDIYDESRRIVNIDEKIRFLESSLDNE